MITFAHKEMLWLLVLLIPAAIFFWISLHHKQKVMRRMGDHVLVQQLIADYAPGKFRLRFLLRFTALLLLLLALAGPRIPGEGGAIQRKGRDVIIALDVSNSMLAADLRPSRLERARQLVTRLVEKMPGENFGFIFFAGRAYLPMPLSADQGSALMFLHSASPAAVPTQGTAIGPALQLARESFSTGAERSKLLLLITDGEDHDKGAENQAAQLQEEGIALLVIGVGSTAGATIADPETGEPRKDKNGNIITTRLNEEALKAIAVAAGGAYGKLDENSTLLEEVKSSIEALEKKEAEQPLPGNYRHLFLWLLVPAILLLLLDMFVTENRKKA